MLLNSKIKLETIQNLTLVGYILLVSIWFLLLIIHPCCCILYYHSSVVFYCMTVPFTHVNGHSLFLTLAIINSTALNVFMHLWVNKCARFCWVYNQGWKFLGHRVCKHFSRITKQFYKIFTISSPSFCLTNLIIYPYWWISTKLSHCTSNVHFFEGQWNWVSF